MVNGLPFSRFLQLRGLLIKARQEESQDKFIMSAFIGWQMGAGAGKRFGEYLEELGLLKGQVTTGTTPESGELTAKEAIAKAEGILAMARKKGEPK